MLLLLGTLVAGGSVKLIKCGIDIKQWEEQYLAAISDCFGCPCCGAPTNDETINDVIEKYNVRRVSNTMRVNCYRCKHCDAAWESKPYKDKECFRTLMPKRYE